MHSLLAGGLEDNSEVGKYRTRPVFITGSSHIPTDFRMIKDEMKKLLDSQNNFFAKFHPVIAAAKLHKDFVMIHPFMDGNGRVARLLMKQ